MSTRPAPLLSCVCLCVSLYLGLLAQAQAQQVCKELAVLSSPNSRFMADNEGNTVDGVTLLMWMRCPLGQTWVQTSCQGQAQRLNWVDSLAQAQRINASGEHFYNDWRVPSLRELATVSERQCTQPRINLSVFPGTPPTPFWTGTASLQDAGQAYALDFGFGGVAQTAQSDSLHVRLVRTAP